MTLITETFLRRHADAQTVHAARSLVAIGMAANITIGILGVPHEWGWTYVMLIMLPAVFLLTDAGRSFGVDAFVAPPLDRAAENGSRAAWLIRWLVCSSGPARHGIEEDRMLLKDELKSLRERAEAKRPPEIVATMHRAVDELRASGASGRGLKAGEAAPHL